MSFRMVPLPIPSALASPLTGGGRDRGLPRCPYAILHLQWRDLDFEAGQLAWRARWDKTGRERVQPMTAGARGPTRGEGMA
jgi:hypothetical protein